MRPFVRMWIKVAREDGLGSLPGMILVAGYFTYIYSKLPEKFLIDGED
jgi:hypothetical protein